MDRIPFTSALLLLYGTSCLLAGSFPQFFSAAIPDSDLPAASAALESRYKHGPDTIPDFSAGASLKSALWGGRFFYTGTAGKPSTADADLGWQTLSYRRQEGRTCFNAGIGYDLDKISSGRYDDFLYDDTVQSKKRITVSFIVQNRFLLHCDAGYAISPDRSLLFSCENRYSVRKGFEYLEEDYNNTKTYVSSYHTVTYYGHHRNSFLNDLDLGAGFLRSYQRGACSYYLLTQIGWEYSVDHSRPDTISNITPQIPEDYGTLIQFSGKQNQKHVLSVSTGFGDFYPEKTYIETPFRLGWLKAKIIFDFIQAGYVFDIIENTTENINRWERTDKIYWGRTESKWSENNHEAYIATSFQLYLFRNFYIRYNSLFSVTMRPYNTTTDYGVDIFSDFSAPLKFGLTFVMDKRLFFEVESELVRCTISNSQQEFIFEREPSFRFRFLLLR